MSYNSMSCTPINPLLDLVLQLYAQTHLCSKIHAAWCHTDQDIPFTMNNIIVCEITTEIPRITAWKWKAAKLP